MRGDNVFTIYLYKCTAENNRVDKGNYLSQQFPLSGTLRENSNVIDPIIRVEKTNPLGYNYNYMHIPEFGRWYFINDTLEITTRIWEIRAHVDVLYTWRAAIKGSRAVIDKTASFGDANLYLDDGSFVMDSHKYLTVRQYPSGFQDSGQYILICAGGV